MSDGKCRAELVYLNPGSEYACVLDRGHEGAHQDMDGDLWTIRFPDESPKLSAAYIHGALDGLRGRIERLEEVSEPMAPLHRILNAVERLTDTIEQRTPLPAPELVKAPSTCTARMVLAGSEYDCTLTRGHGGHHQDSDPAHLEWALRHL